MHIGHSLDSIKPIELEIAPTKALRKRIITGIVLALQLKLSRRLTPIIHIISAINRRSNIKCMLRIFIILAGLHMELSFLHESIIS